MDSTHKVHSRHHQEDCCEEEIEESVLPQLFLEPTQQTAHNADQNNTQTVQTGTWSSDDCELKETSDHTHSEDIEDKSELQPQDLILKALKDNNYELFSSLLKKPGVDPKFKYGKPHYTTLIELACRLPSRGKFVKILLKQGVKPNVYEIRPQPIHYAAKCGNPEALESLLQHKKTNVNIVDSSGRTALHHAVRYGHKTQQKKTRVNAVDSSGRTALHHAVRYSGKGKDAQYERCIELLLGRTDLALNIPNEDGYTAVHEAANFSKTAVQLILKHRKYDVDLDSYRARGRTARESIQNKYPDLIHLLPEPRFKYQSLDHHSQLLSALQNRQLKTFHDILCLVDENGIARVDPNYFYEGPHYATCLEIACRDKDSAEYVKKLLRAGADPNFVNPKTKKTTLHLAAEMGNIEVLSVLLEDTRTNVNAVNAEGKTVMHLIAEHGLKTDNQETTPQQGQGNQENGEITQENEEAMHILKNILKKRKSEIDISLRDKDGLTALEVCLQNGNTNVLEFIVEYFFRSLVFDGTVEPRMEALRKKICKKYPHLYAKLPENMTEHRLNPEQTLFQHLYNGKFEEFRDNFSEEYKDIDNGHFTLLQYATLHNSPHAVRLLLQNGADPNRTTKKENKPPIITACINNSNEIMKLLLDLVPNNKLDVNATDAKGNTALHHAAKTENLDLVVDLIRYGADIQRKNVFGKPPLPAKSVQYFLDNSLKTNGKFPDDEDYKIIFDYGFLLAHKKETKELYVPQTSEQTLLKEDEESGGRNDKIPNRLNPEMDFIFYISRSNEHREILKHPIITSFLHMKWDCVKYYFYINLCIYVIFAFLLNTYILLKISHNTTNETESMIRSNGTKTSESNSLQFIFEDVARILILLILLYFTARELLQLTLSPKVYVTNPENILDICLIFFSGYILLWSEWHETCVVITILLTWTEIILLTGRLPKLSNNIEMLKTVSVNYFWFLFSYIFLLIAFAFSFYSLLHKSANQSSTRDDDKEYQHFFMNPFMSVMKSFIMMMGEFSTDSMASEMENSWTYFCLFALFLFIISMVLLNLLTGLAVSDTQKIKSNAEQLSLVSRIRLIYEIECTLLQWNIFVEKLPQYKLLCPYTNLHRRLLKNMSLFPDTSYNKRIHVLPNKGTNITFGHKEQNDTELEDEADGENEFNAFSAPKESGRKKRRSSHIHNLVTRFKRKNNSSKIKLVTIKEAIVIISNRGAENDMNNTKEHFSRIQEVLESKLSQLEEKINQLVSKVSETADSETRVRCDEMQNKKGVSERKS